MSRDIEAYEQLVGGERQAAMERRAARAMRWVALAAVALVAWFLGRFEAVPDSVAVCLFVGLAVAGLVRITWALSRL